MDVMIQKREVFSANFAEILCESARCIDAEGSFLRSFFL